MDKVSGTQDPAARGRMAGQDSRIDDTMLIREAQRGNRAAFEELVRHYDQAVLRLALHLTGSEHDAQDISRTPSSRPTRTWEASASSAPSTPGFTASSPISAWTTCARRQVRKEDAPVATDASGEEYDLLDQVPDGRAGANPERDLMRRAAGRAHHRRARKLTPRERMVFELKHYHGLKLRTVGEILHTTEETAKNTLFRATQKLRGALADYALKSAARIYRRNPKGVRL